MSQSFEDAMKMHGGVPVQQASSILSPVQQRAAEIRNPEPVQAPVQTPMVQETPAWGKPLTEIIGNAAKGIKGAVSQGSVDYDAARNSINSGDFGGSVLNSLRLGKDAMKGVLAAPGAAFEGGVKTAGNVLSNIPGMQTVANSKYSVASGLLDQLEKGGIKSEQLAQEHPNVAEALDTLNTFAQFTALGLGAGKEPISKTFGDLKSGVVDTFKGAPEAAADAYGKVKTGVTDLVSKIPKSTPKPVPDMFEANVAKAKKILNPTNRYTPNKSERLYNTEQTEAQGSGILKRDVPAPKTTPSHEALADIVKSKENPDGVISIKNTSSENIKSLKGKAREIDNGLNRILKSPENNVEVDPEGLNQKLEAMRDKALKSKTFVSKSAEESAYNDVVDIAKEEAAKQPSTPDGIRQAAKNFNARTADLLGEGNVYGAQEGGPVESARIRGVKEARSVFGEHTADALDEVNIKRLTAKMTPGESKPLIEKARSFESKDDFIKDQLGNYSKSASETQKFKLKNPETAGKYKSEVPATSKFSKQDLGEIWEIANSEVSSAAGDTFRAQLRREAQFLNAADDIGYNSRGTLGKTQLQIKAERYAKANPIKSAAAGLGAASLGAGVIRKLTGI